MAEQQTLDLEAIAKKYGGAAVAAPPVSAPASDADAIAKKYGGVAVEAPPERQQLRLSVGKLPYVAGLFSQDEADVIGRSAPAQALEAPTFRKTPIPAPINPIESGAQQLQPGDRLGSAKTGGGAHEPLFGEGILDTPAVGARQVARGAAALVSHPRVLPTEAHVLPPDQPGAGTAALNAGSDLLEGAMKVGSPLVIAGALANLPETVLGLATAYTASAAAGKVAELAHASPEMQRFLKNLAGASAAVVGGRRVMESAKATTEAAATATSPLARAIALAGQLSGRFVGITRPVETAATTTEAVRGTEGVYAPLTPPPSEASFGLPDLKLTDLVRDATDESLVGRARNAVTGQEAAPPIALEQGPNRAAALDRLAEKHGGSEIAPEDLAPLRPSSQEQVRRTIEEGAAAGVPANEPAQRLESERRAAAQATETPVEEGTPDEPGVQTPRVAPKGSIWGTLDARHREALRDALGPVEGGNERWQELRRRGATNEQILEQAGQEFGISGSRGSGDVGVDYKGGKTPGIVLNPYSGQKVKLAGTKLAATIREALGIPEPVTTMGGGVLEARRPVGSWELNPEELLARTDFDMVKPGQVGPNATSTPEQIADFQDQMVAHYNALADTKGRDALPELREHLAALEHLRDTSDPEEDYAYDWEVEPYLPVIPKLEAIVRRAEGEQPLPFGKRMVDIPPGLEETRRFADVQQWAEGEATRTGQTVDAVLEQHELPKTPEAFAHWIYPANPEGVDNLEPRQRAAIEGAKGAKSRITPKPVASTLPESGAGEHIPATPDAVSSAAEKHGGEEVKPADVIAVQRAWNDVERAPQTEAGLESAVPSGQPQEFYRALLNRYAEMADRAEAKARRSGTIAEADRWRRIATGWRGAEARAKLHFENATSGGVSGISPITYFRSGASRPTDFDGLADAKVPIGVTLTELSNAMEQRVIDYVNGGGQVFIDSGAFGSSDIDHAKTLARYSEFADELEDDARGRLSVVGPDVAPIGENAKTAQRDTVDLQIEHQDAIRALIEKGVNVILPVQKGPDLTLGEQMADRVKMFGDAITIGVPFNKGAYSAEDVAGALKRADGVTKIHLLGIGERSAKYKAAIDAIREAAPDVDISTDSNRMAAMFSTGRPAAEAVKERTEQAAQGRVDDHPNSDTTELMGDLSGGRLEQFSAAEIARLAKAVDMAPKALERKALAGGDGWQKFLDLWDMTLDSTINQIALERGRKAEGPGKRREVIAETEGGKALPKKVTTIKVGGHQYVVYSNGRVRIDRQVGKSGQRWEMGYLVDGDDRLLPKEVRDAAAAAKPEPKAPAAPIESSDARQATIEAILNAQREEGAARAPEIVPVREVQGSDGKWYRGDMPRGVTATGERRDAGFVFRDRVQGTTHGIRYKTEDEAKAAIDAKADRDTAELRKHLDGTSDADLNAKANYWLGGRWARTLADHDAFMQKLHAGDTTPEQLRAVFNETVSEDGKKRLRTELESLKKDDLLKRLDRVGAARYKNDKKDAIVNAAWSDILMDFALGEPVSYSMGKSSFEDSVRKMVDAATPETIAAFAEKVAEARKSHRERLEGYKKALTNPETLEEFDIFVRAHAKDGGEKKLTPEQRATYDELRAGAGRAARAKADEQRATVTPADQKVGAEIIETTHTKKGHDLFVVQLAQRVERDDYTRLNNAAKRLGGYYSSYRGNGAVPGFTFTNRDQAEAFRTLATTGDTTAATELATERRGDRKADKKNAAAQRLVDMADALEQTANEKLSADRLTNTAKRAAQAESADASARADLALAKTMKNLAEAIESGEATHLDGIRTKAQIQTLERLATQAKYETARQQQKANPNARFEELTGRPVEAADVEHAEWPEARSNKSNLMTAGRWMVEAGGKQAGARLIALAEKHGDDDTIPVPRPMLEALVAKEKDLGRRVLPWHFADNLAEQKRLEAAGIPDAPTLRAALREFIAYRGTKPAADRVKQLERALAGNTGVGYDFFPTPEPLADRMAAALELEPGMTVLEPSAGNGNLADAVRRREPEVSIDTVEMSSTLREILEAKGYSIVAQNFDDYAPDTQYDRVIMNPPFSDSQDAKHVQHAYELLKPGGRLVAITGEGIFFRENATDRAFREWFDRVGGESEQLEEAFTDRRQVKTTGVASRLLTIDKPMGTAAAEAPTPQSEEVPVSKEAAPEAKPLGEPPVFWTGGHGPETPEFRAELERADKTVKQYEEADDKRSRTREQVNRHKYGSKAKTEAEARAKAADEDVRGLFEEAQRARDLAYMMRLRKLAEDPNAPIERRWAAVAAAAHRAKRGNDPAFKGIYDTLKGEAARRLAAAGVPADEVDNQAGVLASELTTSPLSNLYSFDKMVPRVVERLEDQKGRSAAMAKLEALEKDYGIQSSRWTREVSSATSEDSRADVLRRVEEDFKATKAKDAEQEQIKQRRADEAVEDERTEAQLLALKKQLVWRWVAGGPSVAARWQAVKGSRVLVPGVPLDIHMAAYKLPKGDGWNVTEESTGLRVGDADENRETAIRSAAEQIKKVGVDKLRAKIAEEAAKRPPRPFEASPIDEKRAAKDLAKVDVKGPGDTDTPAEAALEALEGIEHTVDLKDAASGNAVRDRILKTLARARVAAVRDAEAFEAHNAPLLEAHGKARTAFEAQRAALRDTVSAELKESRGREESQYDFQNRVDREVEKRLPLKDKPKEPTLKAVGRLTLHIPNDGTFTIERTPAAIDEVSARIKRLGSPAWVDLIAEEKRPKKKPTKPVSMGMDRYQYPAPKNTPPPGMKRVKVSSMGGATRWVLRPTGPSEARGTTLQSTIVPGAAEFVEQDVLPGLKAAADTFTQAATQLQHELAPASVGAGTKAAGSLRAMMAREAQQNHQMMVAAAGFQAAFDTLLKSSTGRDTAVDWWDAVQTGQPSKILPELRAAADYMRSALDAERDEVQKVGKLDEFNEFYFPQIWKFPKEEANWVRRKLAGLMGRRPFEGSKSFLKQRKYPTFRAGLEALAPKGIEPISYNPVDHFLIKMREMRRYRVARQSIEDFKAMGIWKSFGGTFGVKPDGWTRIDGPLGTIYGPREVAFQEAYDPDLFEGLEKFAKDLRVMLHRRPNIGGTRWGYAEGDYQIVTKAAGPEGVLMHELGHILDERYGLRGMVKEKKFKQELRDLADLRHEGTKKEDLSESRIRYERKGEEKIANLVHAFLYAPDRAKKIAPNSYWAVYNLAKTHAELKPLLKLQKTRSLKLGARQHTIDVGGFPEIGYHAMPDDAARVFNNHLSRGLNGRFAIYDAYRWLNNTMVTGQLAFSGLFHVTFTGLNALASEGGKALLEVARGAQTGNLSTLASGAKRLGTATALGAAGAAAGYAIGGPTGLLWAAGYPIAAMKFAKGWRARVAWTKQDAAGRFFSDDVRQMVEGGFRPTWDEFYDTGAMKNAIRALRQGNYPGALARTIPAALDAVTRPVMSWLVPSVKTAAYLDLAAHELGRLQANVKAVESAEAGLRELPQTPRQREGLRPEQKAVIKALEAQRADNLAVIREALNKVQASIDNRFGEVVYDNWFWKRWLKDLTHVVFRSPGWQFGTYKEIGGAVTSQARILARRGAAIVGGGKEPPEGDEPIGAAAAKDNRPKAETPPEDVLSMQMAWLLALIGMTMLMGGLEHYLATGERPHGRDWIFPKGPDGQRRAIPTYLRTVVGAWLHPVRTIGGITAPLNTALYRVLISNETYNGELIREPGDPFRQQAWDALRHAAGEGYQPFVVSNIKRGSGSLESTMGVAPAAAELQRTDAENYLHEIQRHTAKTHEEAHRAEARRDLRTALKGGDTEKAAETIASGDLSRRSVMATKRSATKGDLARLFQTATLTEGMRAYELSTPEERRTLQPLLLRKYHTLIANVPPNDRAETIAKFKAVIRLPMAARAS